MTVKVSTSGNTASIEMTGDFDFSTQEILKQAFEEAIHAPSKKIEVNMAETTFIDSSVIRMFLKLSDAVKKNKKSMALVHCNERIREIFVIGGFDQIFEIN